MKLITLILLLTYTLMGAVAEESAMLLDYETDYKTAVAKAKKEHKMVLMVIVQDPCPYCDKLVHKTLDTPCMRRHLKDYIPLIVDKHGEFPKQFKPPFIPMSYVVDPNSKEITYKIVGAISVKEFMHGLETELEFREEQ